MRRQDDNDATHDGMMEGDRPDLSRRLLGRDIRPTEPRVPKRIRLSRAKGYRKPEGAVVVSRPSKWGNPFVAVPSSKPLALVTRYRSALLGGELLVSIADVRVELRGKDLACWCKLPAPGKPDICHAAILLEIANS